MGGDFSDSETLPSASAPAAAAPTPAVVAKPVVVPPVVTPPAAVAAPVVPAAGTPPVAAAQPQTQANAGPETVEDILKVAYERPDAVMEQLIPQFALSTEQIAALEADAPAEVPKLLAHTYFRAVTTSLEYVKQLVPQLIAQHNRDETTHRDAEKEFFGKFKGLSREKHGQDIVNFSRAFAQANPGITRQQLFDMVGTAVMTRHGIVPQVQVPGSRVAAPAFTPAANSAPIVQQTQVQENGSFMGLGQDYD